MSGLFSWWLGRLVCVRAVEWVFGAVGRFSVCICPFVCVKAVLSVLEQFSSCLGGVCMQSCAMLVPVCMQSVLSVSISIVHT